MSHRVPASAADLPALTTGLLDEWESKDPKIIPNLFQLFTATSPYTLLPAACKTSSSVANLVFDARVKQLGTLIAQWLQHALEGTGRNSSISEAHGGAYRFHWVDNILQKISFLDGTEAPADVHVDLRTFDLKDRFSIQHATLERGIAKYPCIDFFSEGQGPKKYLIASGKRSKKNVVLQGIAERVLQDKEAAELEARKGKFDIVPLVGVARKRQLAESLKTASAKAAENAKRRRTLSLAQFAEKAIE